VVAVAKEHRKEVMVDLIAVADPVLRAAEVAAMGVDYVCTVLGFRQKFTLEDATGSHACSLEALACGSPPALTVATINSFSNRCHHKSYVEN
jgi:hypothetical protein